MNVNTHQSGSNSKFAIIFGGVWLVLAIPFILAGIYMLKLEQRYEDEGISVPGTVSSKRIEERRERDRQTKREEIKKSYYVKYNFDVSGDQHLEGEDSVSSDVWQNLSENSPIQIQYLKGEPEKNRVAHAPERLGGILFLLFGGIAEIVGLVSIGYVIKKKRTIKNLIQNGMMVDGTITKVYASSLTINDQRQWQFEYSYRDLKGGQHTGKSDYLTPDAALAFKSGLKGRVRYDQNKPQKSLWVQQA
jgi:hypothetical protein